jgi:integrase
MIKRRVTSRGEARYEVRFRGADGKERSRTFRVKKEAERYERSQQSALDRGIWVDPRSGRTRLREWANEWQRTVVHLRPKTRRIYDGNLRNHILPVLGDRELAKLTPSILQAWLSDLSIKPTGRNKPLAPGTVAQAYRTLNRVLSAAVDNELIGRNPLQGVKPPQVPSEPMRFLSHDEVATLADAIGERYGALVLLAAYGGLRAGELIALRRKHLDLLRRTVSVVEQVQYLDREYKVSPPKSASGRRSVAIPAFVATALEQHLERCAGAGPDAIVFSAPQGGHLHLENFRKRVWDPTVARAGLAPLRLHDLRHTCASLAIAAGADVKVLQRMLGHASAALTLDRYGHLMPGQAETIADRLDAMARAANPLPSAEVVALPVTATPGGRREGRR